MPNDALRSIGRGEEHAMRFALRTFVRACVVVVAARGAAAADEPLPGTAPLTQTGDFASRIVDGADRLLLREIEHNEGRLPKAERYNVNHLRRALSLEARPRAEAKADTSAPQLPLPLE